VAHCAEECCLRPVRSLGAPSKHQREVIYLRVVECEGASGRQVFSKLHVLRAVRKTALSADEGDSAKQPLAGNKRYSQERSDPELTQDVQILRTVGCRGERNLDILADGDRSCVAQHRRHAKGIVPVGHPCRFQLLRELLFFRIRVVDPQAIDRTTFLQNVHDAPGAQSRKRKPRERAEGAGLIHRFGKQAAGFSEESRAATRGFGILGETAFAQCTEEHLFGNVPLQLERSVRRARLANLDAESLGPPLVAYHRPHTALPAARSIARRVDALIQ
jgi:hypothetical protein